MKSQSRPQSSSRSRMLPILATLVLAACAIAAPHAALADSADPESGSTVECMLPGQIHNIAGHATMGARRPVQTTAEDCRQRGGEYTVDAHATQPVAPTAVAGTDTTSIRCLLPRQKRQLGSKARYATKSRIIHTTASDCQDRQGRVLASNRTTH